MSCLRSPSLTVPLHCLLCHSSLLIYSHCHFHLISAISLSSCPAEATCQFTEQGQTSERERWHLIQSLPSFTLNPPTHTFSSSVFIHPPPHSSVCWNITVQNSDPLAQMKKKTINMKLFIRAKRNLLPYQKITVGIRISWLWNVFSGSP